MSTYGTDLSTYAGGVLDIDPLLPVLTTSRTVLESCVRRLTTPRGFLRWAPDYGYDLRSKLGQRMSPIARARMASDIVAELERDERVRAAEVQEFSDQGNGRWRLRIGVRLAEGPFTLVVQASTLTVELLRTEQG
jgi:hypothetical protein